MRGNPMECVANFEINSECSVVHDDQVLRIVHPTGLYRARIQNIKRQDFANHFRLSLHLYFDAPNLNESRAIANTLLAECLNMLAFTTGSKFEHHRIRQIVDATPGIEGMRDVLLWTDSIQHEDPQPFLDDDIPGAIEKLSVSEIPPAIQRALRWYRLGVNADVPDDQFTYFWFAIEIVAEHAKSTEKVSDKCSKCGSALFCETCNAHPTHRPYPKQAIHSLMLTADAKCNEETVKLLDKTRNSLMHGATLSEIEAEHADLEDHIVDILGRILFKALVTQFPHELFDGSLAMGFPSTFVHRTATGIVHMQTVVPVDEEGEFDLGFEGFKAEMKSFGPPQSAVPTIIRMTAEQYERLRGVRISNSETKETIERIYQNTKRHLYDIYAQVLSTDMELIRSGVENEAEGEWQELFKEILESNSNAQE